jgi:hypothetical protein
MEENKPFKFGGISNIDPEYDRKLLQKKLRREKYLEKKNKRYIEIVEREIDNVFDSYYCEDRVKHHTYLCVNEYCNCLYKTSTHIEEIELKINKKIILDHFTKHNIKIKSKYVKNILKSDWYTTNGRFGMMIYRFIQQCKYVYDLDLIIEDIVRDKSATDTYYCENRVPDSRYCCTGGKLNKKEDDNKCRCFYSFFSQRQLCIEFIREWFYNNKDELKLNDWEKTLVTFQWNFLSDNQIKHYNNLLLKFSQYF